MVSRASNGTYDFPPQKPRVSKPSHLPQARSLPTDVPAPSQPRPRGYHLLHNRLNVLCILVLVFAADPCRAPCLLLRVLLAFSVCLLDFYIWLIAHPLADDMHPLRAACLVQSATNGHATCSTTCTRCRTAITMMMTR